MKRKRFSEEQIIRILKEAEQGGKKIRDLCRVHGISENAFYRWRRQYAGMQVNEARRLRELSQENGRLKRLVAERDLEIDALRDLLGKNW